MLLALRSLYERLSLIAEAGTFSVTGGNANLTYTQLPSRQYALGGLFSFYLDDRDIRQAAVFGQYVDQTTQGILQSYTLTASAGTFTLSGAAAGVFRKFTLTASSGSFTFTGNATALLSARKLPAAAGSFSFTGGSAAIYSGLSFGAQAGTFALTGAAATLRAARTTAAQGGSFAFTGGAASLTKGRTLAVSAGTFVLTGAAASFARTYRLSASAGTFSFTGADAGLTYTPIPGPGREYALGGLLPIYVQETGRRSYALGAAYLTETALAALTLTASAEALSSVVRSCWSSYWSCACCCCREFRSQRCGC
jgi:hypothetical protein